MSQEELEGVGESEDYLRVASNPSVLLELTLALEKGLSVDHVVTFGSLRMALIAVALCVSPSPVHVFLGGHSSSSPLLPHHLLLLRHIGCHFFFHPGPPPSPRLSQHEHDIVLAYYPDSAPAGPIPSNVDGVVAGMVLFIADPAKIPEPEIMIRRKRMATPVTTPVALHLLKQIAGLESSLPTPPSDAELAAFYAHLQEMSGTPVDPTRNPTVFTAGLPTLASLWIALINSGGADILMASTAYGGSSQLTDLLITSSPNLRKFTFDLQGERGMEAAIRGGLEALAHNAAELAATTVVFIETPSNPDMKGK